MKKLFLCILCALLLGSGLKAAPITGTFSIPGDYATIAAAFTDLNTNGVGLGGVTFNVAAGYTESVTGLTLNTATSIDASHFIIFQRSGSGVNPKITASGGIGSSDGAIVIAGTSYVTFDGIDIAVSTSSVEYGYLIQNVSTTQGSQHNTIKNCKITLDKTNAVSTGIYQMPVYTPTSVAGANSYNNYNSVSIDNAYNGMYISSQTSYRDQGCVIEFCKVGTAGANSIGGGGTQATWGIRCEGANNLRISGCEVCNITMSGSKNIGGIFASACTGLVEVYNNKVHDVKVTSTSTTSIPIGLRIEEPTGETASLYNNMTWGFAHGATTATATILCRAISLNSQASYTGTINVFNNTAVVSLGAPPSSVVLSIAFGYVNLKNNIFVNSSTAGATSSRYCLYAATGTISSSDYNDLYIASGTNNYVGNYGGNKTLLSDWRTATGGDANSINASVNFISASDIHLNVLSNCAIDGKGTPTAYTTDIDGDTRNATHPDMGADEFTGNYAAITNSPLSQSVCSGNNSTAVALTSSIGGATYSWTATTGSPAITGFTASGSSSIPVQTLANPSTTSAGNVTYAITATANGCPGPVSNYIITVNTTSAITLDATAVNVASGVTSAALTYSASTGSPLTYSIDYDATANTAGFADVTDATFLPGQIDLSIPAGAAATTYNAMLTVKNNSGCSSVSYPITITVTGFSFTVTQNIGTTLLLTWTGMPDANLFAIQYRLHSGGPWIGSPAYINQSKLSNLLPGTEYDCRLVIYKNGTFWGYSQIGNFTTATVSFTDTYDIGTTCKIAWNDFSPWANLYAFQYRASGSSTWIGTPAYTNSTKINNLLPETTYECRVIVYKSNIQWGITQTGTFTTGKINFSTTQDIGTTLQLGWTAFSGTASSYAIQYRQAGSGTWIGAPAITNSAKLSNLIPDQDYESRVIIYMNNTMWGTSQTGTFHTGSVLFTTLVDNGTSVQIGWPSYSPWATSYTLQYSLPDMTTWITVPNTTTNNVLISPVITGQDYFVRLRVFIGGSLWGVSKEQKIGRSTKVSAIANTQSDETISAGIYPNPVADQLTLILSAEISSQCNWSLYDITGKLMLNGSQITEIGPNSLNINVADLAKGVYMLTVYSGNEKYNFKVVKQ
ncbi:MAG: fibronectin type III domain-containing protein [Bacteroidota bacterium]